MRVLALFVFTLLAAPSVCSASEVLDQVLLADQFETEATQEITRLTEGYRYSVWVIHAELTGTTYRLTVQARPVSYVHAYPTVRGVLEGVSMANSQVKATQFAELVAHELHGMLEAESESFAFIQYEGTPGSDGLNLNPKIGVGGASAVTAGPQFVESVWIQLPGVKKRVLHMRSPQEGNGKTTTTWMRTYFEAQANLGEQNSVAARISGSVWSMNSSFTWSSRRIPTVALLRVGTLKLATRSQSGNTDTSGEVELVGIAAGEEVPITTHISAYAIKSIALGVRVLERDQPSVDLTLHTSGALGARLYKQFLIEGNISYDTGTRDVTSSLGLGGQVGWQPRGLPGLLSAGVSRRKVNEVSPDPFDFSPTGTSVFVRFGGSFR